MMMIRMILGGSLKLLSLARVSNIKILEKSENYEENTFELLILLK